MNRNTKLLMVTVVMAAIVGGVLGTGCGRSHETATDAARAKAAAVRPAPAMTEAATPASSPSADATVRPAPPVVGNEASASSNRAAPPAGVIPGEIEAKAAGPGAKARRAEDPFPRPEDVPLAEMGHKKGPSPVVNSPGYYPPNDPEAESFFTGRRKAAAVDVPFTGGESSPERLALAILDALRTEDNKALHALRVTEDEFTKIMWLEFPQSRPICNSNAHDTFFFLDGKCRQGVGLGLSTWGGQEMRLLGIDYTAGRAPYLNFTLYHGVQIHVRMSNGEEAIIKFVQAFAERRGVWKVYNYQDKE